MNYNVSSILICLFFSLSACQETKEEVDQPNIIFIMSDDHAAQAITAYGSIYKEHFSTPNIDRLAQEGVKFNNVFCTNAICGPSRASILTGKYSHANGYYKNEGGGKFDPNQWTFPEELHKHGYQTSLFGKWHLGSEPVGFDFYKYHEGAGQQGYYWDPVYNENGEQVKEEGYSTNLTTDFALDWLSNKRKERQPFCMLLQYKAPHRNWDPDKKYETLWDDVEMPYPATFNDTYKTREQTAGDTEMTIDDLNRRDMKLSAPQNLTGQELSQWHNYGNKREEVVVLDAKADQAENKRKKYQRYIKDYLACIKSVDDNVGRLLDYLEKTGEDKNTIIVYTSDQGFYLGEHGWFDKRFIYEESLRMPFLVRYPNKAKAGTQNNDIITNIDFAPTLCEAAGISVPQEVQGKSFYANLLGHTPENWQSSMYYHYYEFPYWHHVQPHYGLRNKRYKLAHFYYDIDVWEFYDLKNDPSELINEIDNPEYASVVEDMKKELNQKMHIYSNDKQLSAFRIITDTNFGKISNYNKH